MLSLVLPLVLVAMAAAATWALSTRARTSQANCIACHAQSVDHLSRTAHDDLACGACHDVGFGEGIRLVLAGELGLGSAGDVHARPNREQCVACHSETTERTVSLKGSSGHVAHVFESPKLPCTDCHASAGHDVAPNPLSCVGCHEDVEVFEHDREGIECLSCHNFLASANPLSNESHNDCLRCHGEGAQPAMAPTAGARRFGSTIPGPTIGPDQNHGGLASCALCHSAHEPASKSLERVRDCNDCHEGIHLVEGQHDACSDCHEVHGPRPQVIEGCAHCHDDIAAGLERKVLAASHARCGWCHQAHEFQVRASDCAGCHKPQKAELADWASEPHSDCRQCHQAHSGSLPGAQCVGCHQQNAGHGHAACTTCHRPHGSLVQTPACKTCHEQQVAATASLPPEHRNCTGCHSPHDINVSQAKCGECHAQTLAAAAIAPGDKHRVCGTCHDPHSFTANVTRCAACHARAGMVFGAHAGQCDQCHQPHGNPGSGALDCRSCHSEIPVATGKHARCTTCHQAHQAPYEGPACGACHGDKLAGATAWSAPEHRRCSSCHKTHQPAAVKGCGDCHSDKGSAVAGSKHRCTTCHQPHGVPSDDWWSGCADCHQGNAASVQASRVPEHSRCQTCHEPHRGQIKSCANCHSSRPGAHATKGHGECLDCHSNHSTQTPNSALCRKCHDDLANHFPDVSRCSSCHLFK